MTQEPDQTKAMRVPRPRVGLLWIAILLVAALAGLWRFAPALFTAERSVGGPFALVDSSGKRVTNADLAGKPYAMFFGYTHCPDVCPTTLSDMTDWLKALGPDAVKLKFVFVTVDPARDTVAALADYMKGFDPRILALTGSEADIAKALAAYRVYARKVDVKGADYAMDHTAAIYLMTGSGDFRTLIGYGETSAAALARLKELIGDG